MGWLIALYTAGITVGFGWIGYCWVRFEIVEEEEDETTKI